MVKKLDLKLLRDLRTLKGQMLTIAVVVGFGIAGYVSMSSTYRSLLAARDDYYADARFADVFATVQRAPTFLLERVREIPDVSVVEGRAVGQFRVEVPGAATVAFGRFVSLPAAAELNRLTLSEGRLPAANDEVVLSKLFAHAHGLRPGARIWALLNGRRTELEVVGVGGSPEYVWIMQDFTGVGDDKRFGVVWMPEPLLTAALRLEGEINDVTLSLAPGANEAQVVDAVDRLLEPYGSFGVTGRDRQQSNQLLNQELQQLESSATAIPLLFLGVAAFLLNVLLSRLVSTQREQVATLKALGYPSRRLALHYAELALVVIAAGAALGAILGVWLGRVFMGMYTEFFEFPVMDFRLNVGAFGTAAALTAVTALLGARGALRKVLRLAPAEAMRPEAPQSFHTSLLDQLHLHAWLPVSARMVLRELERHPFRTALSAFGVALAVAILVAGSMGLDAVNRVFSVQFEEAQREDLTVTFADALPARVQESFAALEGVFSVERRRMVPVRLRSGRQSRETALLGLPAGSELQRVVSVEGRQYPLPEHGILLSRVLADRLELSVGDPVDLEVLEADRRRLQVPLAGVVDDSVGTQAYMELGALDRLLQEAPRASSVLLRIDPAAYDALNAAITAYPRVSSVARRQEMRTQLQTRFAEAFTQTTVALLLLAGAISVGVVYNNARVALSLRSRDLATLRILGYQRSEVASVLLGEQAVQLLLGIPLGFPLGYWMGRAMYSLTAAELFRIPAIVSARTLATAATVVLLTGLVSGWLVTRRVNRVDLVSVLKARD